MITLDTYIYTYNIRCKIYSVTAAIDKQERFAYHSILVDT